MRARASKRVPRPPVTTFAAHRPTARQFFATVLLTGLVLACVAVLLPASPRASWSPEPEPTLEWTLMLSGAGMLPASFFLVLIGYQRLTIDGSAIRVKSTATMYRWRSFDAREVSAIRYCGPGQSMSVSLTLMLAPEGEGAARPVTFAAVMWWSESAVIDNAVFKAVVGAVARVRPNIVVEGLPAGYDGPLRAPALLDAIGAARPAGKRK